MEHLLLVNSRSASTEIGVWMMDWASKVSQGAWIGALLSRFLVLLIVVLVFVFCALPIVRAVALTASVHSL
jgi:hypothetical protein